MTVVEISGLRSLVKRSLITLRQEGLDRLFLYATRFLSWKLQLHRLVRSLPIPISTATYALVRATVRRTIWLLNRFYPHKYTDADPYKRILVDPSSIEHTSGASRRRGWVVDDEWDKNVDRFMQRTRPKAIEQHFHAGLDWNETVLGDNYDETELERRADAIDRLYQHICNEGYKSQRQLLKESPKAAWNGLNDAMHPLANEIAVDIGRNGEILWNMCGQHRLAIAKVLDIDRIPVEVFCRHKQWQTIRNKVRNGEDIPEEFLDHPDLNDLLNKDQS